MKPIGIDRVYMTKSNRLAVSKPDTIALINPIEKRLRSQLHSTEQGRFPFREAAPTVRIL
jgi:hypothetical protein